MSWIPFSNDSRIRFLELVIRLNQDRIGQLSAFGKSIFYHHWHKIFNEHDCWLLEIDGEDLAFLSKPAWNAKHWMRWPENIFLVDSELMHLPSFPKEFSGETAFRTGTNSSDLKLENCEVKHLQSAYVIKLSQFNQTVKIGSNIEFCCLGTDDLPGIIRLLAGPDRESDVEPGVYEEYYLPELIRMIEHNHKQNYGFGYYARDTDTQVPIAVVFYEGYDLPLTGGPCVLVSDILVKKGYRQQGIASNLQRFGYLDMKQNGVDWVMGNIDPENVSSLKQAQSLGRRVWSNEIELKFR